MSVRVCVVCVCACACMYVCTCVFAFHVHVCTYTLYIPSVLVIHLDLFLGLKPICMRPTTFPVRVG